MHCLRHSRRMVTKTRQKVHWLHDLSLLRLCQYLSSSLDVCHCELRFVRMKVNVGAMTVFC